MLRHPGGVNLGVSRTRRLGILEASGEYIAFLDADDAFEPSKLERQVSLMKAHPACVMCHTGITAMPAPSEDQEQYRGCLKFKRRRFQITGTVSGQMITEYSFLDRPDALTSNVICNSSALAVAAAVRTAAAATRQAFQTEDFVQWVLLATKGHFVFTPEPLTRYRIHTEASSYLISEDYLKHLYRLMEFLLSVHALTDDSGLRARTESELLNVLGLIRDVYAQGAACATVDSRCASYQPAGTFKNSSWENPALSLQAQVNHLQAQVSFLSERLATIRGSRVYQSLVKIRNLMNGIKPVHGESSSNDRH